MHKNARNCTYIEENAHLSAQELHEMYQDAFERGYQKGRQESAQLKASSRNTRDFCYSLAQETLRIDKK